MTDVTTTEESASEIVGGEGHGLLTLPDGTSVPARFHPLANLLPMMEGKAYDEFVADVRERGVQRPIVLIDDPDLGENLILDGRNRYMAARDTGVGYRTTKYVGNDPAAFVVAENIRRRHLSESQRAMVAAKLADLPAYRPKKSADLPTTSVTTTAAAEQLNVSPRLIGSARVVHREAAPEVQSMVESGKVSVSAAADVSGLPVEEQAELAAAGPAAVREGARKVREERQVERWRQRVEKLEAQADDGEVGEVGRVNTRVSIAVHLLAKGRADEAAVVSERAGVSPAGLCAAHRMLTASPEDQRREQREIAIVVSAVMAAEVEVRSVRQVVDYDPDERRVRAWRAGWAAAVLMRSEPDDLTTDDERAAFREGFDAFSQRFDAYLEGSR